MTPEEIPAELTAILDKRAGGEYSRNGAVMQALAEILTRYRQMLDHRCANCGQPITARNATGYCSRTPQCRKLYHAARQSVLRRHQWRPGDIACLNVSDRTRNALQRAGITTVAQLRALSEQDLMGIRNFGVRSLAEVREALGSADGI